MSKKNACYENSQDNFFMAESTLIQIACFSHETLLNKKQPPEVFCKKRCSYKFCKIHRKTPV